MIDPVFTVGHSVLSYARFLGLLVEAGVTAVCDVRSAPYSRHFPHFNRSALRAALGGDGVAYAYFGDELGGRPDDPALFRDGVADYEAMANAAPFGPAVDRVVEGAARHRIALMCSEHDPLECHRCLLVGRALHARGVPVRHILSSGAQLGHAQAEEQILGIDGCAWGDLFASPAERLASAYRERNRRAGFLSDRRDGEPSNAPA